MICLNSRALAKPTLLSYRISITDSPIWEWIISLL